MSANCYRKTSKANLIEAVVAMDLANRSVAEAMNKFQLIECLVRYDQEVDQRLAKHAAMIEEILVMPGNTYTYVQLHRMNVDELSIAWMYTKRGIRR